MQRRPGDLSRRRRVRRLRAAFLVVLALVVLAVGWVAGASGQAVLVLGVDRREGDRGRSDTMLLVVPRAFGGLKLLSIPRDTRVELPGRGPGKINAAYAYDGPQASAEAVARLLDIPAPTPVVVDFQAAAAVVDAMGGITYRGGPLAPDDRLRGTWTVVALGPYLNAAFVARTDGDGPGDYRFAVSYDRETVTECALMLMARMEPLQAA